MESCENNYDNNAAEVFSNQDESVECDNNLDNNQQDWDETNDEGKEKQETQQQMKKTELVKQEPFQYPLIGDPPFPVGALEALDKQLHRLRWVVPVIARSDLEQLLRAAIILCREGVDDKSEPCQRFFREVLTKSFMKIMLDDAVINWKESIQCCVFNCAKLLIEICAIKMDQDSFVLLDLMNVVLDPQNKWNVHNCHYQPETCGKEDIENHKVFAQPHESQTPKGWLVDVINLFGEHGGFEKLQDRVLKGSSLNVSIIAAMIRPFGLCVDFLSPMCIQTYIIPVVDKVLDFLMDDALEEAAKGDTFSSIVKSLSHLSRCIPGREDVEAFRLKMILRLLKTSSFSGKMYALNEITKATPSQIQHQIEKDHHMAADKLTAWMKEHNVLSIVLGDNLHQPQYLVKLEEVLRFCIKEHCLTAEHLDAIWAFQDGKQEAIVKNIYGLLARLTWGFSPEQLDHLFGCFKRSWVGASKEQRDDLLDFIHHLAKDDKEGVMTSKVLGLLWNLAHRDDCPMDTMDHALSAHLKILDCSSSQDQENQRVQWLRRCVDELMNNTWVLPALKMMEEIFGLFPETLANCGDQHRSSHFCYRNDIVGQFDQKFQLLTSVSHSLEQYLTQARSAVQKDHSIPAENLCLDNRFNHVVQVQNRLDFMRFVLRDGQLWLGYSQALLVWTALIENPAYESDREVCFKWFARLVSDEPDIEGETAKKLLKEKMMKLNPSVLSVNGFKLFDRLFRHVNQSECKIVPWRRGFLTESVDLIGLNHLWHVVLTADHAIAYKAIELLKDIFTNVSSKLQHEQVHHNFIHKCSEILRNIQANVHKYTSVDLSRKPQEVQDSFKAEATRLIHCLTMLKEYASDYDQYYTDERKFPPHGSSMWGRPFMLVLRSIMAYPQPPEDIDMFSHSNETVAALRRQVLQKIKLSSSSRLELSIKGELLHTADDKRLVVSVPIQNGSMLTAKVLSIDVGGENSSQKSSNDLSTSHHVVGRNCETESLLPSVIMSTSEEYMEFLLSLGEFALVHNNLQIIQITRNLLELMPSDCRIVAKVKRCCQEFSNMKITVGFPKLTQLFFGKNVFQTLYYLEVCHSLLMPSVDFKEVESGEFQLNFVKSGGIHLLMSVFVNSNIMRANTNIMRSCFLSTVKMCKLLFITIGYSTITVVAKALKSGNPPKTSVHQSASVLQNALHKIVPIMEYSYKNAALHISRNLMQTATGPLPNLAVVESLQRIAWAAGIGGLAFLNQPEQIHQLYCQPVSIRPTEKDDYNLFRESLEVLCYALALSPALLVNLQQSPLWNLFVTDLLLRVKTRNVRLVAADQLFYMVAYCASDSIPLTSLLSLLVDTIGTVAKEHPDSSGEFFLLLARLFNHAQAVRVQVSNTTKLLSNELQWLSKIREDALSTRTVSVESPLLEGHMKFAVELLTYHKADHKYYIGSKPGGMQLIEKLVHDFLFPASKLIAESKTNNTFDYEEKSSITPICNGIDSTAAAFKLLTALCNGCVENLGTLYGLLHSLFYTDKNASIVEWNYLPNVESRPNEGFVGLKNAGATGYMNVILHQLFMIPDIRRGVLCVEKAADCLKEYEKEEDKGVSNLRQWKETNKRILTYLQVMFGHLLQSSAKLYAPKGFWKEFRLWGEPVNLKEPHDAFEFFNCLVDAVDEGLKAHKEKPLFARILDGTIANQKICKGCPHRYSREEPFTALNVDVKHHDNLYESLDTSIKGDLLEGINAYYCEKCEKQIDTVKRWCIKKLPQILVIQLKRFNFDWERGCVTKYDDCFEFPRELDMSPYTAATLAKLEGEVIPTNVNRLPEGEENIQDNDDSTCYRLCGVVVHSGNGSGGVYYSFINCRPPNSSTQKWYKFFNDEITECKLDNDEELKSQCFGGEYTGEVYDHVMRKMQYERKKRWWSAYLLFYERISVDTADVVVAEEPEYSVPCPIRRVVQKHNLEFLHHKAHFNLPYFQFIKQLLNTNAQCLHECMKQNKKLTKECEEIALLCAKLGSEFLFSIGLHTKKPFCGPANGWYDMLHPYFNYSQTIRQWFAQNVLLRHPERLPQYLLECPSTEVRNMFCKLLMCLCQLSDNDGPYPVVGPGGGTMYLSQTILEILLSLLKKEVRENGHHSQQYFHLFLSFVMKGAKEKRQLLQLGVPSSFIAFCLDKDQGKTAHSPNVDYVKLHTAVSMLVRCYDLSVKQKSSVKGAKPKPNPTADVEVQVPLTTEINQWIFERTGQQFNRFSSYIKKVIDDNNQAEGTAMLLKHCCWENHPFSVLILSELMKQIGTVQTFELRPIFDLLRNLLFLDDSWQLARFNALFKGVPNMVDGIMDIIQQAKQRHQKRAYLCIKFLADIFHTSQLAVQIIYEDARLKKAWKFALVWLNGELEKKPNVNQSPSAQSNEVSKGYYLERSNSVKITLKRAVEIFPIEDVSMSQIRS